MILLMPPVMSAAQPPRLEPHRHEHQHPVLDAWRVNIGEPLAFDARTPAAARITGIDVLCWNIAIGLGRLEALVDRLHAGAFGGAALSAERPLVILVQEAFRAGSSVPDAPASAHHGGKRPGGTRHDIADTAHRLGFSLRYTPSMRNGAHASDRGNAILSNVRLARARAFLLPHVRQRRAVVTAGIHGHDWLRFASAHLDTHGQPRRPPDVPATLRLPRFGAGRAAQASALARTLVQADDEGVETTVLGADLNSVLGMTDPAVRALVAAGLHPARRCGTWRHTAHPARLLLDHVLYRCTAGRIARAEVVRLDERAGDRTVRVFGSDHHPLLARIELVPPRLPG